MNTYAGLTSLIVDYIKQRETDRLEKLDKEAEKELKGLEGEAKSTLEATQRQKRAEEQERFKPVNWLSDAASRAGQLSFVTHGIKFIHSDAKGSSLYDDTKEPNLSYLSTRSLSSPTVDVVGNAAALDVGKLLLLESEGKALYLFIKEGDAAPLEPIADSKEQLGEWMQGFSQVFSVGEMASHKLAKQLYWPISENQYHLLAPLYATSLAHDIHEYIRLVRYSEESKAVRALRRESKYSDQTVEFFPEIAVQSFGGTKPQNISQLNSQRGGKSHLFSSLPPNWTSQAKPPFNCTSIFSQYFERRVYRLIAPLKKYLEKVQPRSTTFDIKEARRSGLDEIVSEILNLAAAIQNNSPAWSTKQECKLPQAERYWLDPLRAQNDEVFAQERDKDEWQREVANNFARWIISKLESDKLAFGAVEHTEFRSLLEPELRLNLKEIQGVIL